MKTSRTIHFEKVGDIAIIQYYAAKGVLRPDLASNIFTRSPSIRLIVVKTSKLGGAKRTARITPIYGSGDTCTTHREYGFMYHLDVACAFFNPRLAAERNRIAHLIKPEESVLIPFAGVGPFAVPAAAKGAEVLAFDSNLDACRWCQENAYLNKVNDTLSVVRADVITFPRFLSIRFDRIISPSPYGMKGVLAFLRPLLKEDGTIHYYTFIPCDKVTETKRCLEQSGWIATYIKKCGNVAPGIGRFVFDLVRKGSAIGEGP